ncbi:DinB family protein [Sediminibacterium roseum]|uniref:DinB family protein n=1 Tax=Sediminibacterium roseum TaxID=1978412 RepID=A0ABW9ZSA0_9BACT|nr:DinB family protein [Sediminibacterium roseum]NCI48612.1 DinB family protein [Sediminibacterium roseum]
MRKLLLLACLLSVSLVKVHAQVSGEMVKEILVKDWERAKAYTNEYLNSMPADKYGAYAVDSIKRSFAQQMLHLAAGTFGLSASGTGEARKYVGFNMEQSKGAQSKDSVVYYVNEAYDFTISGIKNMDAAKLSEHVKRGNLDETRLSWLMKSFEHQTHHRGQCTIYIRLQGIRPPNEKLF